MWRAEILREPLSLSRGPWTGLLSHPWGPNQQRAGRVLAPDTRQRWLGAPWPPPQLPLSVQPSRNKASLRTRSSASCLVLGPGPCPQGAVVPVALCAYRQGAGENRLSGVRSEVSREIRLASRGARLSLWAVGRGPAPSRALVLSTSQRLVQLGAGSPLGVAAGGGRAWPGDPSGHSDPIPRPCPHLGRWSGRACLWRDHLRGSLTALPRRPGKECQPVQRS